MRYPTKVMRKFGLFKACRAPGVTPRHEFAGAGLASAAWRPIRHAATRHFAMVATEAVPSMTIGASK